MSVYPLRAAWVFGTDCQRGTNQTYNLQIKSQSNSSGNQSNTAASSADRRKVLQNPQPPRNKKEEEG